MPSRIDIVRIEPCQWYLLKDETGFAIQYCGPDADKHLPVELKGFSFYNASDLRCGGFKNFKRFIRENAT